MAETKTAAAKAKEAEEKSAAAKTEESAAKAEEKTPPAKESTPDPKEARDTSASASLKNRRAAARNTAATDRQPTQTFDYGDKPTELSAEQAEGQNGLPQFHPGGPAQATEQISGGHRIGDNYAFPDSDGFIAFVPENCKSPATIRVWSKGQAVRRDVYDHYKGKAGKTAEDAPVLESADLI